MVGGTKSNGIKLRNIVAYHDFGVKLNLVELYNSLRNEMEVYFEPELSPALMIKLPYTVRIFHNGKAIFTGFKSFGDLDLAFPKIQKMLSPRPSKIFR